MSEAEPEVFRHRGIPYGQVLAILHQRLKPDWYIEVGTATGKCLAPVVCNTVCVDPRMKIEPEFLAQKPRILLFQMTSDDFFASDFIAKNGIVFDMAFLDGLHLFEFLLRDFMNTERHCHEDSVILMHDCLPLNADMTRRDRRAAPGADQTRTRGWTGDVWKVIRILQTYRPELSVTALDCPPTGLVMVRGLDPGSTVLSQSYDEIIETYGPLDLEDYGFERYYKEVSMVDSRAAMRPRQLAQLFAEPKSTAPETV